MTTRAPCSAVKRIRSAIVGSAAFSSGRMRPGAVATNIGTHQQRRVEIALLPQVRLPRRVQRVTRARGR